MQKIGRVIKETCEKDIRKNIDGSNGFFIVKYSGVASASMSALRQSLRSSKSRMFVAKNSVSKRVLSDIGLADISNMLQGPCGFVFAKDDPALVAKLLYSFKKDNKNLEVEGGLFAKKVLNKKDVSILAALPAKVVLHTKLVTTLKVPICNYVFVVSGILKKFVFALDQIKIKKEA